MDPARLAPYVNRFKQLLADRLKRNNKNQSYYNEEESQNSKRSEEFVGGQTLNPKSYHVPGDYTGDIHAPWARKAASSPWGIDQQFHNQLLNNQKTNSAIKLEEYRAKRRLGRLLNPARLTGRLRFKKTKSSANLDALNRQAELAAGVTHHHQEDVTCSRQFREYCASTSLHGWRYLAEKKRSKIEQLFWLSWVLFGLGAAMYMMSKIWTKWERNPIITSVATTNHPVSSIVFPAVTICTVNKAATEKLIIQGCRYKLVLFYTLGPSFTLSQMRTLISILVDPDARNNDHLHVEKYAHVKPEVALKYLRLVSPKCEDYLLSCRWNSAAAACSQVFRLVLTDSGYCCTFNAVETKKERKDSKHDMEVMVQEKEYEYLQRAVWEYTDTFRSKAGGSTGGSSANKADDGADIGATTVDNFNCVRQYDDDLFPGVCHYLQKCRESTKCKARNRIKTNATSSAPIGSSETTVPFNIFAETFPLKVAGAGRSRGLTLMLDTLRMEINMLKKQELIFFGILGCDTVPTDSFKGLRVYVHNADDFPAVAERGYIVGPGMETQISVTAVDTYSANVLKGFSAITRGCFFPHEFPLKFYKEYSRSACIVECETEFINQECNCVTYYSPGNYSVCTLKTYTECVKKALDSIQKKTLPSMPTGAASTESSIFQFKSQKEREQDKTCAQFCLPSCNETFYNVFVTAADFPNQPIANQTKMLREAIVEGGMTHLNDISYVSGSISVLRIFFRESSIMQYKRDELFTWEDFVSNLGGVLSLCMGFSIISVVEVFYFLTVRTHIDKKTRMEKITVAEIVK